MNGIEQRHPVTSVAPFVTVAQPLAIWTRNVHAMDTAPNAVTKTLDTVPLPSLQDRIQTLTDVHNPSSLADFPPSFDPTMDREFGVTFNSTPTHDFRALKDFLEVLCSDKAQEALQAARASEDADHSELGLLF
ncbi:hypothetical protein L210DRAFT_2780266 [Boletus edulis BED1]|uniref:Uncharacterized protein n=1 Tax=Boletus edulis BED1 TaxID=1328754 RepID=A0AAD4G4N7_BOLED|nr:hypothetical protein L210DRAFT_2780266 [Boletus edulis BED1]